MTHDDDLNLILTASIVNPFVSKFATAGWENV